MSADPAVQCRSYPASPAHNIGRIQSAASVPLNCTVRRLGLSIVLADAVQVGWLGAVYAGATHDHLLQ
jgi:hypothetical protein